MKHLALLTAAVAVVGCMSKPAELPPEVPATLDPIAMPEGHPNVLPLPDPELNNGNVGRAPRRITVQQLKNSIQVTTGRQWSQIDTLAPSLGKADFALISSESTEPNLVFAKFLEDGAREVCIAGSGGRPGAAKEDLTLPAERRTLSPMVPTMSTDFTTLSDAVIVANLKYLSVRFWGQPMSDTEAADWAVTFKAIAARAKTINKPEQAWGTMCVAFMTDSRFVTY